MHYMDTINRLNNILTFTISYTSETIAYSTTLEITTPPPRWNTAIEFRICDLTWGISHDRELLVSISQIRHHFLGLQVQHQPPAAQQVRE